LKKRGLAPFEKSFPVGSGGARLSWVGWRAGRYPTVILPEKVCPICVVASFFTGIPALLARSAAGFGLQRSAMGRDFGARIALAAAEVYALLPD
jgi:hypothetical protein